VPDGTDPVPGGCHALFGPGREVVDLGEQLLGGRLVSRPCIRRRHPLAASVRVTTCRRAAVHHLLAMAAATPERRVQVFRQRVRPDVLTGRRGDAAGALLTVWDGSRHDVPGGSGVTRLTRKSWPSEHAAATSSGFFQVVRRSVRRAWVSRHHQGEKCAPPDCLVRPLWPPRCCSYRRPRRRRTRVPHRSRASSSLGLGRRSTSL